MQELWVSVIVVESKYFLSCMPTYKANARIAVEGDEDVGERVYSTAMCTQNIILQNEIDARIWI